MLMERPKTPNLSKQNSKTRYIVMKLVKFIVMLKLCSTLQIVNEKLKFLKRTSKKDRSYDFSTLVYTYILLIYI